MLVLQETADTGRYLRMFIGQPEARAIQAARYGVPLPRPSTWDLFATTIDVLGAALDQVVITAVEEGRHFFATLELSVGGDSRVVPCRPSDAVALALRVEGAKIMAFEDVMKAAGIHSAADGQREESPAGPAGETAGEAGGDGDTVPVGDPGPGGDEAPASEA